MSEELSYLSSTLQRKFLAYPPPPALFTPDFPTHRFFSHPIPFMLFKYCSPHVNPIMCILHPEPLNFPSFISSTLSSCPQTDPCGTPQWMAPEVISNYFGKANVYDRRCDVFSYAVLLWEIFHCKVNATGPGSRLASMNRRKQNYNATSSAGSGGCLGWALESRATLQGVGGAENLINPNLYPQFLLLIPIPRPSTPP